MLFLEFGAAHSPGADARAVIVEFGGGNTGVLVLGRVQSLINEMNKIEVDWKCHDLTSAGKMVRAEIHKRYPTLSNDALSALEWKFTFDWR